MKDITSYYEHQLSNLYLQNPFISTPYQLLNMRIQFTKMFVL